MNTKTIGIVAITAILMLSCGQKHYEEREYAVQNESAYSEEEDVVVQSAPLPETYISSSAAVENLNDTTRNFIRTAEIEFKVKDVIKATYSIEDIIIKHGGFVEYTRLASEIIDDKEVNIKEDSLLVITCYRVVNNFILRVPNTKLDTALKEIAKFADFMNFRIIKAEDVTIDLISKKLEQDRLAKYDNRLKNAIDNKGKRLNDVTNAEDNLLHKQQQADEAKLANLRILDKIKFSTIELSLYQDQSIKYDVIAKEKYSIPFGVRVVDALKFGWNIVVEICLFVVNFWSVILIGGLVVFSVKYFRKKRKKEK